MNHPIEQNAMPPLSATAADAAKTAIYSGKRKAFVLVMLLVSWILANADRMAMSISIVPISKDFNLDARSAGLLLSAFYVSYSLMQLVAGQLSDRFGPRLCGNPRRLQCDA
ncbi:MFS transporter [Paraburkholderia bryophila]|uniref:MFS transporter n=1 Tax=Paraburkholderia bryophila TaxID=420952 RepID=A0A329BHF4_9BURK|nr:MFS transporter [Paraburkholderia bryophila]RAS21120.1 MFS transporter [Paraburkholderia bryophila]